MNLLQQNVIPVKKESTGALITVEWIPGQARNDKGQARNDKGQGWDGWMTLLQQNVIPVKTGIKKAP